MPQEDHIVHLEGFFSSSCWKTPCERESGKAKERDLTWRGITFLPMDAAASLVHLEGNMAEFHW